MSLIEREKLRDYFYYGVNDNSILGTSEEDQLVIDIINEQPEAEAVPLWKIKKLMLELERLDVYKDKSEDPYFGGYNNAMRAVFSALEKELEEYLEDDQEV